MRRKRASDREQNSGRLIPANTDQAARLPLEQHGPPGSSHAYPSKAPACRSRAYARLRTLSAWLSPPGNGPPDIVTKDRDVANTTTATAKGEKDRLDPNKRSTANRPGKTTERPSVRWTGQAASFAFTRATPAAVQTDAPAESVSPRRSASRRAPGATESYRDRCAQ